MICTLFLASKHFIFKTNYINVKSPRINRSAARNICYLCSNEVITTKPNKWHVEGLLAIYDFLGQAQISSETGQTTWIPAFILRERLFETSDSVRRAAEEREQMPVKGNEERDSFGNRPSGMCSLTRGLCRELVQVSRGISLRWLCPANERNALNRSFNNVGRPCLK